MQTGSPVLFIVVLLIVLAVGAGVAIFLSSRSKKAAAPVAGASGVPPATPSPVNVTPAASPLASVSPAPEQPPATSATNPRPPKTHDVFISYSSKDKPTADAVCAIMEQQGVRCWITPRDVLPGDEWAGSIVRAISGARVVVLIFSAASNASPQVLREVERAVHAGAPIIPFRIEDTPPSDSLGYFISTPHWLDALTPPLEAHALRLAEGVKRLLAQAPA
jgi:hypothetical protein